MYMMLDRLLLVFRKFYLKQMNSFFSVKSFAKLLGASFFVINSCFVQVGAAQENQFKIAAIGFYNVENLFDTEDDPEINDEEFLPDGKNAWTADRYEEKVANMAYAISQIAVDMVKPGLSVVGLAEVENRRVIQDMVSHPLLKDRNYQIVHYDSPDRRGIDVGFIYNPLHFTPTESRAIPLMINNDDDQRVYTRDVLLVGGMFDGEEMFFLVNHWPSRRGGEKRSAPLREAAAKVNRQVYDSLQQVKPHAKVVIMGDLNDDPTSPSILNVLRAKGKKSDVRNGDLFNPFWDFYRRGIGSNAYRDSWSLFDQIIISENFLPEDQDNYRFLKANIFNKQFLIQPTGKYKGYPFRTFSFDNYQGGYSDHFPIYIYVVKPIK
jgi:hypothetical protein